MPSVTVAPAHAGTPAAGCVSRWRKRLAWTALVAGLGVAGLLCFPEPFLKLGSAPAVCDAIILLGGATGERDPVAADLYQRGFSQVIIVTDTGDCLENLQLLGRRGVPTNAVMLECSARSTKENAEFVAPLLRARGYTNVLLVTSWHHSRRALSAFHRYAPGVALRCVVSERAAARRYQLPFIAAEYAKTVYYAVRWGIFPWDT